MTLTKPAVTPKLRNLLRSRTVQRAAVRRKKIPLSEELPSPENDDQGSLKGNLEELRGAMLQKERHMLGVRQFRTNNSLPCQYHFFRLAMMS